MRDKTEATGGEDARTIRLAWWTSFLATLVVIAALGFVRSAQAMTLPISSGPTVAAAAAPPAEEDEEEAEEGEEEFELCEEVEEGEECEEAGEGGGEAPRQCLLSSADAAVSASIPQDKIRLVVRYTTTTPAAVAVDYSLKGRKGSLHLLGDQKHFARSGVFTTTESLSQEQMSKVEAAKEFTVQLHAVNSPHFCNSYFERHLTLRHASSGSLTWSDPGSSFRLSH